MEEDVEIVARLTSWEHFLPELMRVFVPFVTTGLYRSQITHVKLTKVFLGSRRSMFSHG